MLVLVQVVQVVLVQVVLVVHVLQVLQVQVVVQVQVGSCLLPSLTLFTGQILNSEALCWVSF